MGRTRRIWPYLTLAILLVLNGVILWQRQAIADWWVLRDYQPPTEIASLVADTSMTPDAQHLFYVNHPSLEDKASFNQHCKNKAEQTAVLGCYHGDRRGIYLYAVTDERLNGVRQVTAAHEMLHQAYDRLSSKERERIDKLLTALLNGGQLSEAVRAKIEDYQKSDARAVPTELHSIVGTELRDLPAELEEYYKRYFADRKKVVAYSEQYQGEFTRRRQLVDDYDKQLSNLEAQIDANKRDLDGRLSALQAKRQEVDRYAAQSNADAYRNAALAYNSMVDAYNRLVDNTKTLINQYNDIVGKRNELAVEGQQLQQALDSRLSPADKR